ncbi:MAG: ATP-binding cassette domain-containing protein, partial [Anaerolineales bacterium]
MIEMRSCVKVFPGRDGQPPTRALDGFDLTVGDEEFLCLLGPSGCGKTTVLRILAGLLAWESGEVRIDGRPVSGP